MKEWIIGGGAVAFITGVLAAVKLGWVEIPAAKRDRAKTDAETAKTVAEAEDIRIDTAEQLIAMVRAELANRDRQMAEIREVLLEHRVWDLAVADELQRLDPDALRRIGRPPTLSF